MSRVAIKGSAYCLEHVPQLGLHYGNTPYTAGEGEKEYLQALPKHLQTYEQAKGYAPNMTYIGALPLEDLDAQPTPMYENYNLEAPRPSVTANTARSCPKTSSSACSTSATSST